MTVDKIFARRVVEPGKIRRDRCIYAFRKGIGEDIKEVCTKEDYI